MLEMIALDLQRDRFHFQSSTLRDPRQPPQQRCRPQPPGTRWTHFDTTLAGRENVW